MKQLIGFQKLYILTFSPNKQRVIVWDNKVQVQQPGNIKT